MLTIDSQIAVARQNSQGSGDGEPLLMVPVWNGILHEFRNHLTLLLGAATEIRTAGISSAVPEVGKAVAETETNVQRLNALVGLMDAALRDGTRVIADLDDLVERALGLAGPILGRTTVSVHKDRRVGLHNRGSAVESMLAALLMDLVRADKRSLTDDRHLRIEIHVEAARGAILLDIESDGRRPTSDSWRLALANDLAARLGATISASSDAAGYLVRFS